MKQEYYAVVKRVVDADTVMLQVEIGFDVSVLLRVRLLDLYAPELRTVTGKLLAGRVADLLLDEGVTFASHGRDKYGRYLGKLTMLNGQSVSRIINDYCTEAGGVV